MLIAAFSLWAQNLLLSPINLVDMVRSAWPSRKKTDMNVSRFFLAGARGIEPRSQVLETCILAVVLCPFTRVYCNRFSHIIRRKCTLEVVDNLFYHRLNWLVGIYFDHVHLTNIVIKVTHHT